MSGELLVDTVDGVTTLTINRPEVHNALSWSVLAELRAAVAAAKDDPATRVVVLTGAGERAFCAGADLAGMADGAGYADLHDARGELARLFRDLWALGKPTIAKVRGWCLAGGFGLALACDLVVAADDAQFGTPEVDLGLWPYMITVPMLRSMPPKVALELQMTGRRVESDEAAPHRLRPGGPRRRARRRRRRARVRTRRQVPGGAAPRSRRLLRRLGPGRRRRPRPSCTRCSPCTPASTTPPRASPPSPRSGLRPGATVDGQQPAGGADRSGHGPHHRPARPAQRRRPRHRRGARRRPRRRPSRAAGAAWWCSPGPAATSAPAPTSAASTTTCSSPPSTGRWACCAPVVRHARRRRGRGPRRRHPVRRVLRPPGRDPRSPASACLRPSSAWPSTTRRSGASPPSQARARRGRCCWPPRSSTAPPPTASAWCSGWATSATAPHWAATIADLAPLTIAAHKLGLERLADRADDPDYAEARKQAWTSNDLQEGLEAFKARRKPEFRGE